MKKLFVLLGIFSLLSCNLVKASADEKVSFNRPYFLMSDAANNINRRDLIRSHFHKLDQNIYLSGINKALYITEYLKFRTVNPNQLALANLEEIKAVDAFYKGQDKIAIAYFKAAELASDSSKNELQIGTISQNLAKLYFMINDMEQASFYNKEAKKYYAATGNNRLYFNCLLLQSKIALVNGSTSLSESIILKQALPASGRLRSRIPEFDCFLQLGKTYLMAKSLVQAKWFFIQAFTVAEKINYRNGKIESLLLLAKSKILLKDYGIAAIDLRRAGNLIDKHSQVYLPDLQHNLNLVNAKLKRN